MDVILLHGMGRTPFSMLFLRQRLVQLGHQPRLFGYSSTFESIEDVAGRLIEVIGTQIAPRPYALIGHSLGTVIIRYTVPKLAQHPAVCFFLAPPIVACTGAKMFSSFLPYQLYNGEMGQLLAKDEFMEQLPMPENVKIYVGTGGPQADWLPLGSQPNDGILSVDEATGPYSELVTPVDTLHTFIMNSDEVLADIAQTLEELQP